MESESFSPSGSQSQNHSNSSGGSAEGPGRAQETDPRLWIPAYAVGATDPDETRAVEKLLACDDVAAAELARYRELEASLLHSAPPVQPPAHLAARLQRSLADESVALQAARPTAAASGTRPQTGERRARPAWWRSLSWQFAAGVMLLALLLVNLFWISQVPELQESQDAVSTQLQKQDNALVMLASEELDEIRVPAVEPKSGAEASILWHPEWNVAMVYAETFPQLSPGTEYQLWFMCDDGPISGGTFDVNDIGNGSLVVDLTRPLDSFSSVEITAEPTGGSPNPTAPPIVHLDF